MSDQQDFLMDKLEEIRSQFSGHYMTQMNKKLVVENKELKARLEKSLTQKIEGMIKTETVAAEALRLQSLSEAVKNQEAELEKISEQNRNLLKLVGAKDSDIAAVQAQNRDLVG